MFTTDQISLNNKGLGDLDFDKTTITKVPYINHVFNEQVLQRANTHRQL